MKLKKCWEVKEINLNSFFRVKNLQKIFAK